MQAREAEGLTGSKLKNTIDKGAETETNSQLTRMIQWIKLNDFSQNLAI